jgi:hypothetical protein
VPSNVGPLSSLAIGVEFHVAENAQTGFLTPAPLTRSASTSRLHGQMDNFRMATKQARLSQNRARFYLLRTRRVRLSHSRAVLCRPDATPYSARLNQDNI